MNNKKGVEISGELAREVFARNDECHRGVSDYSRPNALWQGIVNQWSIPFEGLCDGIQLSEPVEGV
jgi:hypothetical protein